MSNHFLVSTSVGNGSVRRRMIRI